MTLGLSVRTLAFGILIWLCIAFVISLAVANGIRRSSRQMRMNQRWIEDLALKEHRARNAPPEPKPGPSDPPDHSAPRRHDGRTW